MHGSCAALHHQDETQVAYIESVSVCSGAGDVAHPAPMCEEEVQAGNAHDNRYRNGSAGRGFEFYERCQC